MLAGAPGGASFLWGGAEAGRGLQATFLWEGAGAAGRFGGHP